MKLDGSQLFLSANKRLISMLVDVHVPGSSSYCEKRHIVVDLQVCMHLLHIFLKQDV